VLVGVVTTAFLALPWLPPFRKATTAVVDLGMCNGCGRCAEDCPYGAVTLERRSDGLPFEREAVVRPSLCVSCGICVGACPTSSAFRRTSGLKNAIDLPDQSLRWLKEMTDAAACRCEGESRVIVFGCDHGVRVQPIEGKGVAAVSLPCIGMLPPSFIDYVLSRNLAEGVLLAGCAEGACYSRFGIGWTEQRLARTRDPRLRERVPRERIATLWVDFAGTRELVAKLVAFRAHLSPMGRSARRTTRPALAGPKVAEVEMQL
jgi:ferredoxin/coenzyme F420-reducing hydrogenase delta subunit